MREERGQVAGDLTVNEPLELWGNVGGNVTVGEGGKFYVRGSILGNLTVQYGGRVHIYGQVHGDVTLYDNTKVIHSGMIAGNLINEGGRLYVELKSGVGGKIKHRSGKTKYETVPSAPPDQP
jgi:cytoskeletal protein CcmA (bactofilin family)